MKLFKLPFPLKFCAYVGVHHEGVEGFYKSTILLKILDFLQYLRHDMTRDLRKTLYVILSVFIPFTSAGSFFLIEKLYYLWIEVQLKVYVIPTSYRNYD